MNQLVDFIECYNKLLAHNVVTFVRVPIRCAETNNLMCCTKYPSNISKYILQFDNILHIQSNSFPAPLN